MTYEVTATRKRPQTFDDLSGQEFLVATLKNSLKTGQIAHAYLFSGPRGVGKTSAARILAKALNCRKGPSDNPCGTCASCNEISHGNSLDVIEIDGASNTSVNDVRAIKDEVLFAPNNSRYKVYIIDEVHMLSNSAFNALLKTIEEPPPYIVFIFATTEIHKVPATIRSRCQQFTFRLIPVDIIKELLSKLCDELSIKREDEALFWIAKEATGSMRDAYTLFDQVVSFSDGIITLNKIREKLGLVGLESMTKLADHIADRDAHAALETVEEILSSGVSIEQFLIDLAEYFRSVLLIKQGIRKEFLLGYAPERFSMKLVNAFGVFHVEVGLDLIFKLYRNIRYSLNQRFEFDLLISRLCSLTSYLSSHEILNRIEALKVELSSGKQSTAQTAEKKHRSETKAAVEEAVFEKSSETVMTLKTLSKGVIDSLIDAIKKKKLTLASSLEKAKEWNLIGNELVITFSNAYCANMVKQDIQEVTQKAQEILQQSVVIRISINEDMVSQHCEEEKLDDQVEMVKKLFRGQIVQGE